MSWLGIGAASTVWGVRRIELLQYELLQYERATNTSVPLQYRLLIKTLKLAQSACLASRSTSFYLQSVEVAGGLQKCRSSITNDLLHVLSFVGCGSAR
jgi:hypothetical protein